MKRNITKIFAAFTLLVTLAIPMGMWGQTKANITDNMTASNLTATTTTYTEFSDVSLTSDAKYAGKSAKDSSGNIQLRSSGSDCGIVSTTSGGKIKSVKITVGSGNKTVDVYGSNTAYTSASDLYSGSNNQGTKLGSLSSTGTITVSGDYAYVGVRSNSGSVYLSKIEFTWDNTGAPTPTTPCDIALTGAPVSLSFDLFNNTTEQVIHYTTSSTGTVYVESNDYVNATVNQDAKTITVTPKAITNGSSQTITVRQNADLTYLAGSVQFTVNITDSTPAPTYIFNTDAGLQALGINKPSLNQGTDLVPGTNYNSGDVTMTVTHGTTHTRVWGGSGNVTDLRVYGGGGSLTFSVPTGQQISRIILVGDKPGNFNELGSKAEHTANWMGTPSRTVTLTANNTCEINTITVVYETNTSGVDDPEMPASCNFVNNKEVAITCVTPGATIYYTTDDSDPKTSSTRTQYSAPFTINATTTVKAVAYLNSNYSNVIEATYTRVYNITLTQNEGGVISANKEQAAENEIVTLTVTPSVGYTFNGWNITPSGVQVNSNDEFTMPAQDVTVSASFNATGTRTIFFDINGVVDMTATINAGGSIDLTKFVADVTTQGYTFDGWSLTQNGTVLASPYTPAASTVTLFAVFSQPSSSSSYELVTDINDITAGTYLFGAYSASGTPNPLKYRFATSTISSGDWMCTDYVECTDGNVPSLPTGACEIVLTGDNTNGFTVGVGSNYLGYTASSNRKLAFGNYSTYKWTFTVKSNVNGYNFVMHRGTSYYVYDNSTAASALRGYIGEQSSARGFYLFKKVENQSKDPVTAKASVSGIPANVIVTVKANGIVYLTGSNAGNESNLVVEDGGQLFTSANVKGTMLKGVTGYGNTSTASNYCFISTPLTSSTNPTSVKNMITDQLGAQANNATATYDLYYFDQNPNDNLEWRNYRAGNGFSLYVGSGYLYANRESLTLEFAGTLRKSIDVTTPFSENITCEGTQNWAGWNLIGNPYSVNATLSTCDFYEMKSDGSEIITATSSVVKPMQGIFAYTDGTVTSVTFTPGETNAKSSGIVINVTNENKLLDRAIVRFGEGGMLPKFQLNPNSTKVYITEGNQDFAVVRGTNEGEMPVSFKAENNGTYTLSADITEVEMNYLHLIDNMTGADVDLLATPSYTFDARTTDYASRFRLVFSGNSIDENTTATETFAFFNGESWSVSNQGEASLQVVDVMGRVINTQNINGNATINLNETPGIYMLRLVNGNNVKVQKIVVR